MQYSFVQPASLLFVKPTVCSCDNFAHCVVKTHNYVCTLLVVYVFGPKFLFSVPACGLKLSHTYAFMPPRNTYISSLELDPFE